MGERSSPASLLETYSEWVESDRLVRDKGPGGKAETERLLKQTGREGLDLLRACQSRDGAGGVRGLEAIGTLEQVWKTQQYLDVEDEAGERLIVLHTKESRQAGQVNRELISTPHDVEARYGEKRGKGSTG